MIQRQPRSGGFGCQQLVGCPLILRLYVLVALCTMSLVLRGFALTVSIFLFSLMAWVSFF